MTRTVYNAADNYPTIKDDGTPWPFIMLRNGKAILADTRTELVGALIPGYDSLDDEQDALVERFRQAIVTANFIQEFLAAMYCQEAELSMVDLTEEELTAFFTNRLDHPTDILGLEQWHHDVPLVLVTSLFEPYDDRVPPTGNVMWIDPTNETTYLSSLAELGQLELFIKE